MSQVKELFIENGSVDIVKCKQVRKNNEVTMKPMESKTSSERNKLCDRCGWQHLPKMCPAYRKVYNNCELDENQQLLTQICFIPQIIFYEDRNFQGRHYECSSDCADLSPYFSRCNSIRVESDWWVLYEKPNYMGYQYVLSRGEYPDYQRWMGFNDTIRSCRTYPYYRGGNYRMRIYERPDFGGQMMEFMDDCPSVFNRFRYRDIHSCQVMDGYWIFYEHPNYRGRQYFLKPGEYRRYSDWGGYNSMIGSFRRMRDF
ncbi:gamma-crystallin S-1-like [Hemitrygon akajei]|uniref:gamma-crystallin S-1-like n=1 Tax=Hemitrygon akajei TaxID=2704970 RepID=UPI003BF97F50